jgi:hypothetical protein
VSNLRKSAAILSIAIVLVSALVVWQAVAVVPLVLLCELTSVPTATTSRPVASISFARPTLLALATSCRLPRAGLPATSR